MAAVKVTVVFEDGDGQPDQELKTVWAEMAIPQGTIVRNTETKAILTNDRVDAAVIRDSSTQAIIRYELSLLASDTLDPETPWRVVAEREWEVVVFPVEDTLLGSLPEYTPPPVPPLSPRVKPSQIDAQNAAKPGWYLTRSLTTDRFIWIAPGSAVPAVVISPNAPPNPAPGTAWLHGTNIEVWNGDKWVDTDDDEEISAERVKELYESNDDTNDFSDAEKDKLKKLKQLTVEATKASADTAGKWAIRPDGTSFGTHVTEHPQTPNTFVPGSFAHAGYLGVMGATPDPENYAIGQWFVNQFSFLPRIIVMHSGRKDWDTTSYQALGIDYIGQFPRGTVEEVAPHASANGQVFLDVDDSVLRTVTQFVAGTPGGPSTYDEVETATHRQVEAIGEDVHRIPSIGGFGILTAAEKVVQPNVYVFVGYSSTQANVAGIGSITGHQSDVVGGIYTATVATAQTGPLSLITQGRTYFSRAGTRDGGATSPAPQAVVIDEVVYDVGDTINTLYHEVIGFEGFSTGSTYKVQVIFADGRRWITETDPAIEDKEARATAKKAEEAAVAAQLDTDTIIEVGPPFAAVSRGTTGITQRNLYLSLSRPLGAYRAANIISVSIEGSTPNLQAYDATELDTIYTIGIDTATMDNLAAQGHFAVGNYVMVDIRLTDGRNGPIIFRRVVWVPVEQVASGGLDRTAVNNLIADALRNYRPPARALPTTRIGALSTAGLRNNQAQTLSNQYAPLVMRASETLPNGVRYGATTGILTLPVGVWLLFGQVRITGEADRGGAHHSLAIFIDKEGASPKTLFAFVEEDGYRDATAGLQVFAKVVVTAVGSEDTTDVTLEASSTEGSPTATGAWLDVVKIG